MDKSMDKKIKGNNGWKFNKIYTKILVQNKNEKYCRKIQNTKLKVQTDKENCIEIFIKNMTL